MRFQDGPEGDRIRQGAFALFADPCQANLAMAFALFSGGGNRICHRGSGNSKTCLACDEGSDGHRGAVVLNAIASACSIKRKVSALLPSAQSAAAARARLAELDIGRLEESMHRHHAPEPCGCVLGANPPATRK